MLKLHQSINQTPVLSLRTGGPVGYIIGPIINPNNLYIEGWWVQDGRSTQRLVLLSNDIREVLIEGFVINDFDVLSMKEDLVRLKEIFALRFELHGLKVNSESGKKYGKIEDYAFETSNFFIQKLYSAQSLVKNFNGGTLSIDRSQIIEVTDQRIIIEDPVERSQARANSVGVVG